MRAAAIAAVMAATLLGAGCGGGTSRLTASTPGAAAVRASVQASGDDLDAVERRLETLEAGWTARRDNRAVFATTYRISTRNFRLGIAAGRFEDARRLERAVATFGLLYFHAVDAWDAGRAEDVPPAWRTAFARAADPTANAATHLVLGMNAHIMRDLPFAAAGLAPMEASWHRDFLRCNDVLTAEVPEVRAAIVRRYGDWYLAARGAERWDDALAGRAVVAARRVAWDHAVAIDRDPERGGEQTEAYAADLARSLDQDRILWALWQWLRRTSG